MQLSESAVGTAYVIQEIVGREKIQNQLMNMGLVPGTVVHVISRLRGNLILTVKTSRLGLSNELAERIIVEQEAPVCMD